VLPPFGFVAEYYSSSMPCCTCLTDQWNYVNSNGMHIKTGDAFCNPLHNVATICETNTNIWNAMCLAPCVIGTLSALFICLTSGAEQESFRQYKGKSSQVIRASTVGYDQVNVTYLKLELSRLASISTSFQHYFRQNKSSSRVIFRPKARKTSGDGYFSGIYDKKNVVQLAEEYLNSDSEPSDKLLGYVVGSHDQSNTLRDNEEDPSRNVTEKGPSFSSTSKFLEIFPEEASTCRQTMLDFAELESMSAFGSLRNLTRKDIHLIRGKNLFGPDVSCPQSKSFGNPYIIIFPISYLNDRTFQKDLSTFQDLLIHIDDLTQIFNSEVLADAIAVIPDGIIANIGISNQQRQCKRNGKSLPMSLHLFLSGHYISKYLNQLSSFLKVAGAHQTVILGNSVLIMSMTSEDKIRATRPFLAFFKWVAGMKPANSTKGKAVNDSTAENSISLYQELENELWPLNICFYAESHEDFSSAVLDIAMQLRMLSIFPPNAISMKSKGAASMKCKNKSFELEVIGMVADGNVESTMALNKRRCDQPVEFHRADGTLFSKRTGLSEEFLASINIKTSNMTFQSNQSYVAEIFPDTTCRLGKPGSGSHILLSNKGDMGYYGLLMERNETTVCSFYEGITPSPGAVEATGTPETDVSPQPTEIPGSAGSPSPSFSVVAPTPSKSPLPKQKRRSSCFPSDSVVELSSGKSIPVAQLLVGDTVRVNSDMFSKVIMFSHRDQHAQTEFVRIVTSSMDTIHLSPSHYIYANRKLVRASEVKLGDVLLSGTRNNFNMTVISLTNVYKSGLYNPQTYQGDIVVDGIVASTFTAALPISLAHAFLSPLKILNYMFGIILAPASAAFLNGSPLLADLLPDGPPFYDL
jgi:Hint module